MGDVENVSIEAHNMIAIAFKKKSEAYNKKIDEYNATHDKSKLPKEGEHKLNAQDVFELSKEAKERLERYEKGEMEVSEELKPIKRQLAKKFAEEYKEVVPLLEKLRDYLTKNGPIDSKQFTELEKGGAVKDGIDMDDFIPAKAK